MPGLILGSSSGYRRRLLERLRIPFDVVSPDVEEDAVKRSDLSPSEVVVELARRKALAVAARHPDAVVIGSDQAAVLDNHIFDKPGNREACIEQLRTLQGKEHRLLTSVALARSDRITTFTDVTRLVMRPLTDFEIRRYVDSEEPFDCCGSYRIESLGITLFERIDSRDHTAIIGLPLLQLTAELRKLGVALP